MGAIEQTVQPRRASSEKSVRENSELAGEQVCAGFGPANLGREDTDQLPGDGQAQESAGIKLCPPSVMARYPSNGISAA